MSEELNLAESHKYFSAFCFNAAWDVIDSDSPSPEELEMMLHLSHASLWHWSQREDVNPNNVSIAYWQLSRVYIKAGLVGDAVRYALRCVDISNGNDLAPFYDAYAYEALGRAYALAGHNTEAEEAIRKAKQIGTSIPTEENKKALFNDLSTIKINR